MNCSKDLKSRKTIKAYNNDYKLLENLSEVLFQNQYDDNIKSSKGKECNTANI